MPIGGFNGSDPSPTLEQFKAYVKAGRIHWFIGQSENQAQSRPRARGCRRPKVRPKARRKADPSRRAEAGGEVTGLRRAGAGPGGGTSSAIETWVRATFKATTVGGAVFYDLTAPATTTP